MIRFYVTAFSRINPRETFTYEFDSIDDANEYAWWLRKSAHRVFVEAREPDPQPEAA